MDVNIASYTDGIALYDSGDTTEDVIITAKMSLSLQNSSNRFIQWLSDKQLKRNTEKCHLITSTNEHVDIQLGSSRIRGRDGEKLLGVKIDYKLNFDEDVKTYCKKANFRLIIIKTNSIHVCWKKENTGDIFFQRQFN